MKAIALILISVHLSSSVFFSRRRRAPQPVPADCVLSEWETIQPCSKQCGPDGVEIQERRIIVEGRNGGKSCSEYQLEQTVSCNRVCYNEGTIDLPNSECTCLSQWTGECCDQDVNECEVTPSPCAEICINEAGTYRCECPENYTLDTDDTNCVDLAECQTSPPPCEHRCSELAGGYQCYCDEGYQLADDNKSCDDVDECKTGSICQYRCVNIPGDYECECKSGYYRNPDNKTCTDTDECVELNGGCKQICENTIGGHRCSCGDGYQLADNNIDCIDIDECVVLGSSLCQQLCVNILGSYQCRCESPYTLNTDLSSCSLPPTDPPVHPPVVDPHVDTPVDPHVDPATTTTPATSTTASPEVYHAQEKPDTDSILPPCQSTDESECEKAREKVEAQKGGFDKDTMYNWIIGILIIVCMVLVGLLGVMCVRKGYHRLYPPKPPPISTIPRYNNTAFRNELESESGSGIYDDPEHYAVIGDTSPDYMDMSDATKSKGLDDTEYMEAEAENPYAENPYENGPGSSTEAPRQGDPRRTADPEYAPHYVSSNVTSPDDEVGYSARQDHGTEGFTHEEDYENNPPMYDNI